MGNVAFSMPAPSKGKVGGMEVKGLMQSAKHKFKIRTMAVYKEESMSSHREIDPRPISLQEFFLKSVHV